MNLDYELLDFGGGLKWERFGNNTIIRPEKLATDMPKITDWQADAVCSYDKNNRYIWEKNSSWQENWQIAYGSLIFELRLSQSKNIGIFPEQEANWQWLNDTIIAKKNSKLKVLNLFAYTGAATLVSAVAGAAVCHLDAAKTTVKWASKNAELSSAKDKPIRWIVDDALKFLSREIKRGVLYDGIILDPPPVGRSGKNDLFSFKKDSLLLLETCKRLLKPESTFFLFNCYAMNYSPSMAKNLVAQVFTGEKLEAGELEIKKESQLGVIPCSTYVRFRS